MSSASLAVVPRRHAFLLFIVFVLGAVVGQLETRHPDDLSEEEFRALRQQVLEMAENTPYEEPRYLEVDAQDYDSYLDDDSNLILSGAADQDFNTATRTSGNEEKGGGEVNADELAAIKARAGISGGANVPKDSKNDWETNDLKERYLRGEVPLTIDGITPRAGPITGATRVTVRADEIAMLVDAFPDPKCRFGKNSLVVDADYVKCSARPLGFYEVEGRRQGALNSTCVFCDSSPATGEEGVIAFSVSLTGDFSDVTSSLPYRYYLKTELWSIYPRYGPKDGDTVVQVWGANFLDLGDDFRCNFGTRATKAYLINENYLWCRAAHSDVVGRPMPFSVSLNRQQNSLGDARYWYYSAPQIAKLTPDYGPMSGGTKVTLRGDNYMPFDWRLDINNRNDTFCHWGPLGKTPAEVISSTEAECLSPVNTVHADWVPVNLTLNNQNYTDELMKFYYFNPPKIMEAEPLLGPVSGGTEVNLWGTKFERQKNITCSFGGQVVQATYVSKSHLICKAPPVEAPGDVMLTVKYENDRFESDVLTYTYYANPEVTGQLSPACGPVRGYTQIMVHGKNFLEFGFGTAKCIFNETIFMNATVLDSGRLYCDSPPLDQSAGDTWYNLGVTLDGHYFTPAISNFTYYEDPVLNSVGPWLGPLRGGTTVNLQGTGFNGTNICGLIVRFGQITQMPTDVTASSLMVEAPAANVPGQVVVALSGNGQQFIDDRTLHFRDRSNTYEYYQPFVVEGADPAYLSNGGNIPCTLTAAMFDQFHHDNGTKKIVDYQCRYSDGAGGVLGTATPMQRLSDTQQVCVAPKTSAEGPTKIEVSVNGQDWDTTMADVQLYTGPKVTAVTPSQGVTKNPRNLTVAVTGENFRCPNDDCSKVKVRFRNKDMDEIIVNGHYNQADGAVQCEIPKYPAPETLDVDVAFNGIDFTHDGVQFGYFDPLIEDIRPRLVSPQGGTPLHITGYGFVQMDASKSLTALKSHGATLQCGGANCTKDYAVVDENRATVIAIDQAQVQTPAGDNIGFEPWQVAMMDPDGDFTPNNIDLYYYEEPVVTPVSQAGGGAAATPLFAFADEEKVLVMKADFHWGVANQLDVFKKYANLTCRFTGDYDPTHSVVTPAIIEASPIGQFSQGALPDQIRCRTPQWGKADSAKLDVSVNGHDYFGEQPIQFVEQLKIHKISPLAGPIGGSTRVSVFAQGINASVPVSSAVFVKFGTIEAQEVQKDHVTDVYWSESAYHEEMHLSRQLLKGAEANDARLEDGQSLVKYIAAVSPDVSRGYAYDNPDVLGMGGPVAMQIGERVTLAVTEHDPNAPNFMGATTREVDVVFKDSSVSEFYYYRQPFVKKIEPTSGLVDGGTIIDVTGAWFDEKPQYGVFPFCKIGDTISRGKFVQTTRIQCTSPPSGAVIEPQPVAVSLNAVDWVDTGYTFSYYQKPELDDVQPRSGSIEGGTELWLHGAKFSNVTSGLKTVKCRFTQVIPEGGNSTIDPDNVPVRYVPAYIIDGETMKCASPAGWAGGDQVRVDLTFNGVDYTERSFVFSFYNIFGSFPKSGPAEDHNQFIQIRGKGFREESTILCSLNETKVAPLAVHPGVIKCPMHLAGWPNHRSRNLADYPIPDHIAGKSVPFSVLIDGSKYSFGNFRYYKQIEIDEVTPLIGPSEGRGAIYIIGKDFRDDFENAKLGCRIGNQLGVAQLVDQETIRCTVANKLPLVEEGESLLVSAALNSYSWAPSAFSMEPYGIYDIFPNSGPIGESTNILVTGKGFENALRDQARCKFGTDANYAIVEAQVLDNEHLICKSPSEEISLPDGVDAQVSLPFSVAFQEDLYYPYTEGSTKFRLYRQPYLVDIDPVESQVGRLTEVYITADETDSFWQPIPLGGGGEQNDQYGIKCKFGRFGATAATFINKTTILCLTPNIQDDPADIATESVYVSVAMNGVDFDDYDSDLSFQFIGTGGAISTWVIIIGTVIFGLLIVSIVIFLMGIQEFMRTQALPPRTSYVVADDRGGQQLRPVSRASSGHLGGPRSYGGAGSRQQFSRGIGGGSRHGQP